MPADSTGNRIEEAADAARRAADTGRLLPGEEPESRSLSDAHHWDAVYAELLAVKVDLITTVRQARREGGPAVAMELSGTDLPFLERERDRLLERLDFWRRRVDELAITSPPAHE